MEVFFQMRLIKKYVSEYVRLDLDQGWRAPGTEAKCCPPGLYVSPLGLPPHHAHLLVTTLFSKPHLSLPLFPTLLECFHLPQS